MKKAVTVSASLADVLSFTENIKLRVVSQEYAEAYIPNASIHSDSAIFRGYLKSNFRVNDDQFCPGPPLIVEQTDSVLIVQDHVSMIKFLLVEKQNENA